MNSTVTRFLYGLLALFLLPGLAQAQTGTITGKVTDAQSGNTLPGVNVALAELNRGAATGADGQFTIEDVPVGTYTLRASFVGYQDFSTEVTVGAGETVTQNIELQPGTVGLQEVVVTGYGQQQTAAELTGSVSNLSAENVNEVPVQNANELLQGRISGVSLQRTSGQPGGGFNINIRGQGSINAGDQPLYIVDGVQMSFSGGQRQVEDDIPTTRKSPLSVIDPRNIESIRVLKDAAAAAIYGAQASNGVVLIETKDGTQGETQVTVSFEGGARFQANRVDVMERDEWVQYHIDAFGESGFRNAVLPFYGYSPDTKLSNLPNFSWQDFSYRVGRHRSTSFTANGGDQNTQYYITGNWTDTEAAVKRVEFQQRSLRLNINQQVSDAINLDTKVRVMDQNNADIAQDNFWVEGPFYWATQGDPPIAPPYQDDGSYNPDTFFGLGNNFAVEFNEKDQFTNTTQIVASAQPRVSLYPWLTLNGTFGLDYQSNEGTRRATPVEARADDGVLQRSFEDITNLTANLTLNASNTFAGGHNVDALLGSEYRREFRERTRASFAGFGNRFISVADGAPNNTNYGGESSEFRILSYFGRVNYDYNGRYFASATLRFDGSSRFGAKNRWGVFPAVSAGWRISEESFFNVGFVENLKLRASYGVTGNTQIGNFAARGLFNTVGPYVGGTGFRPGQLANPQLSWEEEREINLGLDYSFWGGRVSGNMNVYRSRSTQLLLNQPLPPSSGYNSITENIGELQNRGFEFEIETVNVQTEKFSWSTRFNVSVRDNTVKELTPGVKELQPANETPIRIGRRLDAWKVYDYAGANPATGRPMYYDKNGNLTYNPREADRKFFDSAEEDFVGGIGTRFSYGGLSLGVSFDYSFGAKVWPAARSAASNAGYTQALELIADDRWKKPGDVAAYPKAVPFGSYPNAESPDYTGTVTSTFWLFKGNYVRLKNISLDYRLPSGLLDKVGLRSARIYVRGLNLWHVSPLDGINIDPTIAGSEDVASYPVEQQFNIGVDIGL
ncbi:MAG: SusC/RagA family TonB-linked outer membrane protein [Salinibacter sp.]|uniref:SusC/RagA family TonB-linked outer membrane protein n=1 Tax=Salinibacter sp. TaxID=2065818 RepID=UPI0035D3F526